MRILVIFFTLSLALFGVDELEYTLYKKGIPNQNTMLIIGGIQGDEPGGFLAASIVATEYNITKGSVWVVPNLNFKSIIERSRGTKGDMNRKFAHIDPNDPDYKAVTDIKKLITDSNVTLILNLHDGSGYYRDKFINKDQNPNKWGNTCIIDQAFLKNASYPDLDTLANRVKNKINERLIDKIHTYHVKNTKTAEGDKDMLRSLTYFAVTQGKSAFANEASKNLNVESRTYYHLLAIEEYMNSAGIEFSRNFELTPKSIKSVIEKDIRLSFFDDFFVLGLKGLRSNISYVPLKDTKLQYSSDNPLVAVIKTKNGYEVRYGNRLATKITPQFFEYSNKKVTPNIVVDGIAQNVKSGQKVLVKDKFLVQKQDNIRVNIIGYSAKSQNEADISVSRPLFDKNYSIDKAGRIFRVEFYETSGAKDKFAGMILVEFR
ncbi:M99 family carboxypeptidase catalytic domain-containing protein [Campylobacter mucosalis]|uniref:M99 family carboxypeptidase catalytic domain-containing protein n=1 Tax=Campylobacter mucosalis TaxID=202 RepID=UPI0020169F7E|nr:M99 family carboxypeptidase catalytic domain-containing protein [Campylobacter mucosalis]